MKDPLQIADSPYELLGVEPGADRRAVDRAFMEALKKRPSRAAVLKMARDTLLDPMARLDHELLQYRTQVFQHLAPSPLEDPSILDPANREATAAAWQRVLKKDASDIWVAHALALLWYWWTLRDEELLARRLHETPNGDAPPDGHADTPSHRDAPAGDDADALYQKWLHVIGYWSMLARTPRFWKQFPDLTESQTALLQEKFIARLQDKLRELSQRYSAAVQGPDGLANGRAGRLAERYRSLDHALVTELATARQVGDAGIFSVGGEVCYAGPLLLQQMNILDRVQARVKEKLERYPRSLTLKALRRLLSSYRWIETLLEENQAQAALDAIKRLPDDQRHCSEVKRLRAQGFYLRGKQEAELGNIDAALENWQQVRRLERRREVDALLIEDVVSTCLDEASKIGSNQPDRAIFVLGEGLKIIKESEKLKAALANHLTRRGMGKINGIQKEVGPDPSAILKRLGAIKAAFNVGLADLDRAAGLGSKDAARLAAEVREALKDLEPNQYYNRGIATINQAVEQAERKKKGFTTDIKAAIRRGLRDLDKAASLGAKNAVEQAKIARQLLDRAEKGFLGGEFGGPIPGWVQKVKEAVAAAGLGNWTHAIELLRQAIREAPREERAKLEKNLSVCLANRGIETANRAVEELNSNTDDGSRPPGWRPSALGMTTPECAFVLMNAENDLEEAVRLDPFNDHAEKNLADVRNLRARLPSSSIPGPSWSGDPGIGSGGKSKADPAWRKDAAIAVSSWLADLVLGLVVAAILALPMQGLYPQTFKTVGDAFIRTLFAYVSISGLICAQVMSNTGFFWSSCTWNIFSVLRTVLSALGKWLNDISKPPRYY